MAQTDQQKSSADAIYALENKVSVFEARTTTAIEHMSEQIGKMAEAMSTLVRHEEKLSNVEDRLDGVTSRMNTHADRFEKIENGINAIEVEIARSSGASRVWERVAWAVFTGAMSGGVGIIVWVITK